MTGLLLTTSQFATNLVATDLVATDLVATDRWHGHDGGWFPWFPLIPLFFFAVFVVLFLTVGRRRWARFHGAPGEAVLAERYARGEIDQAEYLERRSVLRRKD